MSGLGSVVVVLLLVCGALLPLIQRDLRRAAGRQRARRFWRDREEQISEWIITERKGLPPDEFAREHLHHWVESVTADPRVEP